MKWVTFVCDNNRSRHRICTDRHGSKTFLISDFRFLIGKMERRGRREQEAAVYPRAHTAGLIRRVAPSTALRAGSPGWSVIRSATLDFPDVQS